MDENNDHHAASNTKCLIDLNGQGKDSSNNSHENYHKDIDENNDSLLKNNFIKIAKSITNQYEILQKMG